MAAWRSARDGRAGWRAMSASAFLIWLAPLPLGLAVLVAAHALSAVLGLSDHGMQTHPLLVMFMAGYLLLFSPTLSWIGLLIALPSVWFFLRRGWGGWASLLLLGLTAGGLAGVMVPGFATLVASLWGGLAALTFRWLLRRWRPEIFTPC